MNFLRRLSLGKLMKSVPIIFFVGAACLLGSFSWQISQLHKFNGSINLAGRQRMLNQRHAREVLEFALGDKTNFKATRELMVESLDALRNGADHPFGMIQPATDKELLAKLIAKEQAFQRTFETADRYLKAIESKAGDRSTELRQRLIAETTTAHKAAHAVVLQLTDLSSQAISSNSIFAYSLGAVIVTLCSLWALIIGNAAASVIRDRAQFFSTMSKDKLHKISSGLRHNAVSTAEQANEASGAAEQVSSNAGSLSSAVEQFEESIKEIASNASSAASVAQKAVDATERTNDTISRLGSSSSEISNVIKAIHSIAEQTNLLALNATIEAARAGEAGKGFAVVANEVKELAKETSKATEDIVQRVEAIQVDTEEAVNAIGEVSQVISEINESQNAIAGAVEQQSAMTSEISRNVSEVASSSGYIAKNISNVADAAESTKSDSDITIETAVEMQKMAAELLHFVGKGKSSKTTSTSTKASDRSNKSDSGSTNTPSRKYQLS